MQRGGTEQPRIGAVVAVDGAVEEARGVARGLRGGCGLAVDDGHGHARADQGVGDGGARQSGADDHGVPWRRPGPAARRMAGRVHRPQTWSGAALGLEAGGQQVGAQVRAGSVGSVACDTSVSQQAGAGCGVAAQSLQPAGGPCAASQQDRVGLQAQPRQLTPGVA